MRHAAIFALLAFLCTGILPTQASAADDQPLTVAAAISLKESLTDLGKRFEQQTGRPVRFTFGASGQLAAQIEQGAPIDVYISAANQQVDDLIRVKAVDASSRRVVARNRLVLIVPADAKDADVPHTFSELADAKVKRVAVGQPKVVPAGQYARQVLDSLKIFDAVKDRLVYAGNVRQVLDYVERGEVSAGVVYRTDAMQSGEKARVVATAEATQHEPIEYPAVVVSASKSANDAQRFIEFMTTEDAQAVLRSRGFDTSGAGASSTSQPGR